MEVDDGGDLGSLSINNQDSSFNSQDSIQVAATSSSGSRQQSQSATTDRDRPVKSDKEKKSKSKSKEKEIPIRKQGGSLPDNKNQSHSATSTSTSTTSSVQPSISNPTNNPSKTISATISNPPQPHRTTSSSDNSINSNKTTTSSSSSKSNQSSSTSKDASGGSRLNSVKEKMSEGWYRTVGSIKDRDRDSSSGNRSSDYRDDRRRSSASTSQGQGQGDLSIPFSSLDESLSRDKDSSEINRQSISSNRTLNGTTSTINSQNKVSTNDQSRTSTTTTPSSSFSRRNSAKKDQEKEKETSMERLGLGNKFGLGGKVSNASPIDTSSSASKKERDTPEITSPISPSTGKKQKKRRGSKSISSPTKDRDQGGKKGDNSEPSSPVPPRRTSLNISRNDYLKLGLDNENQRREEKELEGLGLDTMNITKQTQSKIQSPTSSSRSRSQSTSKLSSKTTSTSTNPTSINSDPFPSSNNSTFSIALLQRYVLSIGIVNFDLDLGPDLEFLYPPLGISREERDNIAFSSFPDTSIFDDGSCVFSWRVREVPLDNSKEGPPIIGKGKGKEKESSSIGENERENERNSKNKDQDTIGRSSTPTGQRGGGSGRLSTNYIYGYVFFRQKRDSRIRRGYFQKSLVILSHLPYVSLFEKLVRILGTLFFEEPSPSCSDRNKNSLGEEKDETQDLKILTSFCQNVTCWPEPIPGELITLDLPFLNQYTSRSTSSSNLLDISSLIVSLPNSFSSSQTSSLNDEYLLPPSTSAAGRPNSLLISKTKSSKEGSIGVGAGKEFKLKNEIGQTKENPLLANIPSRNLFDTFREVLPDLWLLWECLLLADPILIMAPDPSRCSEAIWHAIDLIRPIPFAGDFRPFFTMQDHDVSILVNKNKPQSGTLLGVTNPFFKQACDHWSSTLRVGKGGLSNEEKEKIEMEERERNHSSNHNKGFHFHHSNHPSSKDNGSSSNSSNAGYSSISQANSMSNSNSIPVGRVAGGNSAGGGGPDHTPGFATKRKRRVSKDRPLLRRLLEMAEKRDTDLAANALLRRYFSSLTEMFLAPLNRYVSTLIPADFDLSSPIETPRLKPFSTNDFLTSLKAHGTPISLKSKNLPTGNNIRQSLYVDFLNCPNFSLWLTERLNQAEEEQRKRRINVLENDDVIQFAKKKGEIESLDLYERLVEEIKRIDERLNQPITLGPSSRWRTDNPNPNASSGQGHKNTSSETSITSSLSGFKSLEKVTSRDSTGTNNSENFVDARSSISSSNYLSDHSDPKTPTMIRKGEEFNTLKNGTTSSGLISGRSTPTTSTSRGVSNSYSSTSTNNQINVKQLKDRKVKLLKQLEKLVETFPQDLRDSLRVKP